MGSNFIGKLNVAIGCLIGMSAATGVKADTNEVSGASQLSTFVEKGVETFEWGLLLEAEGSYANTGGDAESDLILATVEFVADASVTDWLSGHVGLLWEEDDTEENILDEGFITVGTDFYTKAGKFYLPVGNFETAFITDPLTLELAEINRSSALLGYGTETFDLSIGAFKGDGEDVIQCGYASANFNLGEYTQFGAYVLSDLLETDGFVDLNTNGASRAAAAGGYVNVYVGNAMINAEVVSALDKIDFGAGEEMTPIAYNLEASYAFAEKWGAGIKYEGSDDFYTELSAGLDGLFHASAVGGVVSYGFHNNAVIGVEYMRLMNKGADDTDLVTVQLALEI